MAIPDNSYIPLQGLQTLFANKDTGTLLSGGRLEFYEDVNHSVPKNVFQLVQTQVSPPLYSFANIGSVITLNGAGATSSPNDGTDIQVYLYPFDILGNIQLYHIKAYSSGNILELTRDAQPPNVLDGQTNSGFNSSGNMIENPQFAVTFLPPSLTNIYTVSGTNTETPIAPDWSIITSGSGTVTITQVPLSDISAVTSPPFAIDITSSGITSLKLRQKISQSPRLFGNGTNNAFVFASMVARSLTSSAVTLTMDYVPSSGTTYNLISDATTADNNYSTLFGSLTNPNGSTTIIADNTNTPNTPGFINIDITIPASAHVAITSVQVTSTEAADSVSEYIQESVPRQIDHLFHYYNPLLQYKPIPSYLVGWDFALNPAQFGSTVSFSALAANKSNYVWDQTIAFQTVLNSLAFARNTTKNTLNVTCTANTSFALIQYVPANIARSALANRLACQLKGSVSSGTLAGTISLWWTADATLPDIKTPNFNSLVSAITAGVPTAGNGTWNKVENKYVANSCYPFTLGTTSAAYSAPGFQDVLTGSTTATFMAIVVAFDTMTTTQTLTLDYCSMVPGDIPTMPAPKTIDDTIRECQYYYEMSYSQGSTTNPSPSIATVGALSAQQLAVLSGGNDQAKPRMFYLQFKSPKVSNTPLITLNDTNGNASSVTSYLFQAGSATPVSTVFAATSNWTQANIGMNGVTYLAASTTTLATAATGTQSEAIITYHYTADARLGTF